MSNICTFWGKIVGNEDEVRKVVDYFEEPNQYQFIDRSELAEKIEPIREKLKLKKSTPLANRLTDLYGIIEEFIKTGDGKHIKTKEEVRWCTNIIIYRKINQLPPECKIYESDRNHIDEYLDKLEEHLDPALLRELATIPDSLKKNFPKGKHFWNIFGIEVDDFGVYENGKFYVEFFGNCVWNLENCILSTGCYDDWVYYKYEDQPWFKGTCLEKVAEEFPGLEMEFFSEEGGSHLSEHITVKNGKVSKEVQDLICACYESIKDAKKDNLRLTKGELHTPIYTHLPRWFQPGNDKSCFTFEYSI